MAAARVESLTYGPHGVARVDGKVHFVRGVVPGDEVELIVREDRGAYAYAEATRLIQSGAGRREAPCPYLPRCGGCPWQHMDYALQLAAKEQNVRDLLVRVGHLRDPPLRPIIAAAREYGYRRRLSLRVEDGRVGYYAAASHDLVPVDRCLLAVAEMDGAIASAQEWVGELRTTLKRIEIVSDSSSARVVLAAQAQGSFVAADGACTERFLAAHSEVAGVALSGRRWRHTWGDELVRVPLPGLGELEMHAGSFSQIDDSANQVLIETVLGYAAPEPTHEILDLYAGAGNLTLPLARRAAAVTAVERAVSSLRDGEANARRLGLANVTFVGGDVPAVLRRKRQLPRVLDTVVLDPPRGGAGDAIAGLLELNAERMIYVSCNPATLARDLRSLSPRYRVDAVQPIDFFPQTYHVEVVARLRREP